MLKKSTFAMKMDGCEFFAVLNMISHKNHLWRRIALKKVKMFTFTKITSGGIDFPSS